MKISKEKNRGKGNFGWLKANYSFSFANYWNSEKTGYKSLLVINEDFIAPKAGFPTHAHENMEILTIVLKGELGHTDSMGNVKSLTPGKVQRMYAGKGVRHSEFNLSQSEELNLIQIWIKPNQEDLPPEYEEKEFDLSKKYILLASENGTDGSIKFHAKVKVHLLNLGNGESFELNNQSAYLHVIKGNLTINGEKLVYGDSVEMDNEACQLKATETSLVLVFEFTD